MPRKTNKTSHVLNLLTNGSAQDSDGAPEASAPSPNTSASDSPQASSQKVTVVNETGQNDKIAHDILSNLEGELMEEIGEAQPSSGLDVPEVEDKPAEDKTEKAAEPGNSDVVSEKLSAVSGETAEKEKISAGDLPVKAEEVGGVVMSEVLSEENEAVVEGGEEISSDADVSLPAAEEAVKEDVNPVEELEEEPGYRTVNVMEQILVRQKLEDQMSQYEVCQCSRCRADVAALILTRLPAKYVVTDESRVAPIVSYYESKFKVRILTEIIKSCIDVKEHPRHNRKTPLLKPLP